MILPSKHGLTNTIWNHNHRPRFYFMALTKSCISGCSYCEFLGCKNHYDRSIADIERSIQRAFSGRFDRVVFSGSFFNHPHQNEIIQQCNSHGLQVGIQSPVESISKEFLADLTSKAVFFNVIIGQNEKIDYEFIKSILRDFPGSYITYLVNRATSYKKILSSFPKELIDYVFFNFPYRLTADKPLFSCNQVNKICKEIKESFSITAKPMIGQEIWDPRVNPMLSLEPNIKPDFNSEFGTEKKLISVVIPTYNNEKYIQTTLKNLFNQDLDKNLFELIIVDDGSTDQTRSSIEKVYSAVNGTINFKYIYSPRPAARNMGDGNFRAGVSRNLGVKHATGKYLCFLDSDIVTPTSFLSDLIEKHKDYDVIQCKRYDLNRECSLRDPLYDEITPATDMNEKIDQYWMTFFKEKDWMAVPLYWKYTCTYGLSMESSVFKNIGWLKRNFIFYGFEDTDLGYRLALDGYKFYLNDVVTYHLYHENTRSEFFNNNYRREMLLSKTAKIFYLNILDPEIHYNLRGFMYESYSMASWFQFLIKMLYAKKKNLLSRL